MKWIRSHRWDLSHVSDDKDIGRSVFVRWDFALRLSVLLTLTAIRLIAIWFEDCLDDFKFKLVPVSLLWLFVERCSCQASFCCCGMFPAVYLLLLILLYLRLLWELSPVIAANQTGISKCDHQCQFYTCCAHVQLAKFVSTCTLYQLDSYCASRQVSLEIMDWFNEWEKLRDAFCTSFQK